MVSISSVCQIVLFQTPFLRKGFLAHLTSKLFFTSELSQVEFQRRRRGIDFLTVVAFPAVGTAVVFASVHFEPPFLKELSVTHVA